MENDFFDGEKVDEWKKVLYSNVRRNTSLPLSELRRRTRE